MAASREEPRPKKSLKVRSNVKNLLPICCDCNGLEHHEFLPQDRMVNKEYYLAVMSRLREAILRKLTELWKNQSWILYHDNAPAHTSMLVREFLAKNKIVIKSQHRIHRMVDSPLPKTEDTNERNAILLRLRE